VELAYTRKHQKYEHTCVLKNVIFCIKDATVKLAYAMHRKREYLIPSEK